MNDYDTIGPCPVEDCDGRAFYSTDDTSECECDTCEWVGLDREVFALTSTLDLLDEPIVTINLEGEVL